MFFSLYGWGYSITYRLFNFTTIVLSVSNIQYYTLKSKSAFSIHMCNVQGKLSWKQTSTVYVIIHLDIFSLNQANWTSNFISTPINDRHWVDWDENGT